MRSLEVLVLGATGRSSSVVSSLQDAGHRVRAATRRLQIPIGDVLGFASFVVGHRDALLGESIEVASDDVTGSRAASIVGSLAGHALEVAVTNEVGPVSLFAWLDRNGYGIDIGLLRHRFATIRWHTFGEWAAGQDWSIVGSRGSQ